MKCPKCGAVVNDVAYKPQKDYYKKNAEKINKKAWDYQKRRKKLFSNKP